MNNIFKIFFSKTKRNNVGKYKKQVNVTMNFKQIIEFYITNTDFKMQISKEMIS